MPDNNLEIITDRDESISPTGFSTTPEDSTNTSFSQTKHDLGKELPHIDEVDEDEELSQHENNNNNEEVVVSPVTPKRDTPHKICFPIVGTMHHIMFLIPQAKMIIHQHQVHHYCNPIHNLFPEEQVLMRCVYRVIKSD